jgi:pyrroline-5-carboxylate reductase
MKLGFIGAGAITSAMVAGLNSSAVEEYPVRLSPRNASVAADLARRFPRVSVAKENQEVVDECESVVIAVRPQIAEDVLSKLHFPADRTVISLVSGFSVRRLSELVAPATRVTRAVPLPSAARRASPTAIYPADRVTIELFTLLGAAFAVDTESEFDVLCSATATMAAYFAFGDGVASWLARHEIPPAMARNYVAGIFSGLADTARITPERSFQSMAAAHATRGGTNEQVLNHLMASGVFESLSEALDGILRRVTAARSPSQG